MQINGKCTRWLMDWILDDFAILKWENVRISKTHSKSWERYTLNDDGAR